MRHIWHVIFCILLGIPGVQAQQYMFKNYSVGDGLAQSQVFAMIEDCRGYLWMGTRGGGVSRFDGLEFKTFNSSKGLENNFILSLYEDNDKNIWIGNNVGVSRFDGVEFINQVITVDSSNVAVGAILQDDQGLFWFGTGKGIYRFDGKSFSQFDSIGRFDSRNISCLFKDSKGRIWIGSDLGTARYDHGKVTYFSTKTGLNSNYTRCFTEDEKGNIWVGSYGKGINIIEDSLVRSFDGSLDLEQGIVLSIKVDQKSNVWIATQNQGVFKWNSGDSLLLQLTEVEGLSNNHVRGILEDSWGNLWFSTSGGGVSKYYGQRFTHLDKSNGLSGNYIYSLYQDSWEYIWMGASGKGVSRLDPYNYRSDSKIAHFNVDSGFMDIKVKSIFEDHKGRMWFGTEGKGIGIRDTSGFRIINTSNGLGGNWIRDIKQDQAGNIWVAAAGGGITKITFKDSGDFSIETKIYTTKSGLKSNRINCLHVDKWQRIWFGYEGKGLGYLEGDSITNFNLGDGLSANGIRSLKEDKKGCLWVGTAGGGINMIRLYSDSISFVKIGHNDGLASENIYLLLFDGEDNLWAGSETGVDLLTIDESRKVVEIKHYGKPEGFRGIETCQNSAIIDAFGNLWFGTINGLTRFNPSINIKNPVPPITSITDVKLFYESISQTSYSNYVGSWNRLLANPKFPFNQNHIGFEFIGVNLQTPEKVRYQWKLEGFDQGWSPVSTNKNVTYSNLAAGEYVFFVKACNEDNVWGEPQKIIFTILPPYWQKWWFIGSCGTAMILLIVIIIMARTRHLKKEKYRLSMEKNLIQLEQKALRLQMNPHFIFNALNSIQGVIDQNDDKTARYYLAKFSKLMRRILENSRSTTVPLESEIKTLEHYLVLEKFSSGGNFDYEIMVGDEIDPEDTYIPPMMIQPFIENAVIHGLKYLDKKGVILVTFKETNNLLQCTITDNGIGRKKAATMINPSAEDSHTSTALVVTQERLDILNNHKGQLKSLEIIDLLNEKDEANGTKVVINLPFTKNPN